MMTNPELDKHKNCATVNTLCEVKEMESSWIQKLNIRNIDVDFNTNGVTGLAPTIATIVGFHSLNKFICRGFSRQSKIFLSMLNQSLNDKKKVL